MVTVSEKEIVTQAEMKDREIEKGIAAVVNQIELLPVVLHLKKLAAAIRGAMNDRNEILVGNLTLKLKLRHLLLITRQLYRPIIWKAFLVHLQQALRNIV